MVSRGRIVAVSAAALLLVPLAVWAGDRFEDVPDSNVFHDDISWLADSGVTFGCNPPENTRFCPSETVTREQMAAFMRRLSEGQVVDAATAVESDHAIASDLADHANTADTADNAVNAEQANSAQHANDATQLDGAPPTAYQTVVSFFDCGFVDPSSTNCDPASLSQTDGTLVGQISIVIPADGVVELHGSLTANTQGVLTTLLWITSDAVCATDSADVVAQAVGGKLGITAVQELGATLDVSAVEPVSNGTVTYRLCAFQVGAQGPHPLFAANLYARWTEAPPSAITQANTGVTNHPGGILDG